MTIERIHAREILLAPFAWIWSDIQMEELMTLAVMLSRKALATSWPLALIRLLFRVRSHVPYEIPINIAHHHFYCT